MKIGYLLSDEKYERKLNEAIAILQNRIRAIEDKLGKTGLVYNAVVNSPTPIGYLGVLKVLGMEPTVSNKWMVSGRLGRLKRGGWLTQVGWSSPSYKNIKHTLYTSNPIKNAKTITKALLYFNRKVEQLDRNHNKLECMSNIINPKLSNFSIVKQSIINDRLSGETLEAVGTKYGVTKERVRQIVERQLSNKPKLIRISIPDYIIEKSKTKDFIYQLSKKINRSDKIVRFAFKRGSCSKELVNDIIKGVNMPDIPKPQKRFVSTSLICRSIRKVKNGFIAKINNEELIYTTIEDLFYALKMAAYPKGEDNVSL